MTRNSLTVDKLDLTISRFIRVVPGRIWRAWTHPKWFAPRPVQVVDADIDPRAGGVCNIVMRLPDGVEINNPGCVLLTQPDHKLVFTDVLGPGFRPKGGGFMTAIILIESESDGCRYSAKVLHMSEADRRKHEEMGFAEGWRTCRDQPAELVEGWLCGSRPLRLSVKLGIAMKRICCFRVSRLGYGAMSCLRLARSGNWILESCDDPL